MMIDVLATLAVPVVPALVTWLVSRDNALRRLERLSAIRAANGERTNKRIAVDQIYDLEVKEFWKRQVPAKSGTLAIVAYFSMLTFVCVFCGFYFDYLAEVKNNTAHVHKIRTVWIMAGITGVLTVASIYVHNRANAALDRHYKCLSENPDDNEKLPTAFDLFDSFKDLLKERRHKKSRKPDKPVRGSASEGNAVHQSMSGHAVPAEDDGHTVRTVSTDPTEET